MKRAKQITALLLAVAMSFSLLCSNVWASEIIIPDDVDIEETVEPIESETSVEGTDEVSIDTEDTVTSGVWQYSSNDDGSITITKYTGTETDVTIPDTIDGYTVTEIQGSWYSYSNPARNYKGVTSVTIPTSVTRIGYCAFYECSSLTSVTIPSSVTSIGNYAFYGCSSLTSVIIPSSVTSIGHYAFEKCSLTSVTIPSSVTSIGTYAFSGCSSLTSVIIPSSVMSIGEGAFYGCSSLTSVTIPTSVTSIGGRMFARCSSLTSVTIPSSVTSIDHEAFEGCSSLTSVTIPSSVTSIDYEAFSGCSSLTSVTIPSSVTSIGEGAFSVCSSLTSITIPNSITSIGSGAFEECRRLTSVTIQLGVTSIGEGMFEKCSRLTSITIPTSVTSIYDSAFKYCYRLTSVTLPTSVTSIDDDAFSYCNRLTDVYYEGSESDYDEKIDYCFDRGITVHYNCNPDASPISACTVTLAETTYTYDGTEKKPAVTVKNGDTTLVENTDYTVAYTNNINVGTATVTVTGIGNYSGSTEKTFTINNVLIPEGHTHTIVTDGAVPATCTTAGKTAGSHCSVCGAVITQQQTIPALGHSFSNYVSNNNATCGNDGTKTAKCDRCDVTDTVTDANTATGNHNWNAVTDKKGVTCTCTICGTTCKITKTAVSKAVKLSAVSFKYNGKVQKPVVTVQINGITVPTSEYTIKYSNKSSKKISKYKITIKAKKNSKWLSGSVKKTYKIVK